MKKILSFLTKNPIMGALAGALVTAVFQSNNIEVAAQMKRHHYWYIVSRMMYRKRNKEMCSYFQKG